MRSKTQFRVGAVCSCFRPRTRLMLTHLRDGIRRDRYFVTQANVTNTAKKTAPPAQIHSPHPPNRKFP
jgi:hypothetical protein